MSFPALDHNSLFSLATNLTSSPLKPMTMLTFRHLNSTAFLDLAYSTWHILLIPYCPVRSVIIKLMMVDGTTVLYDSQ